jgi:hypothetical protein
MKQPDETSGLGSRITPHVNPQPVAFIAAMFNPGLFGLSLVQHPLPACG